MKNKTFIALLGILITGAVLNIVISLPNNEKEDNQAKIVENLPNLNKKDSVEKIVTPALDEQTSQKETICTGNAPAQFLVLAMLDAQKLQNKARQNDSPATVSYVKHKDTQLGYSPYLGKCVGGYYLDSYSITNNYESYHNWSAVVVVLETGFNSDKIIATYDNSNTTDLAKEYERKLYELTNGEIGRIKW